MKSPVSDLAPSDGEEGLGPRTAPAAPAGETGGGGAIQGFSGGGRPKVEGVQAAQALGG